MTKEQEAVDTRDLDYQIGVMQAFKDRRQIERRLRDRGDGAWKLAVIPVWDWYACEYRIKPTPTLRPWTADEVPLGAFMRPKQGSWRSLIAAVDSDGRIIVHYGAFTREAALERHEYSLDGIKNWLPCGVVEEAT